MAHTRPLCASIFQLRRVRKKQTQSMRTNCATSPDDWDSRRSMSKESGESRLDKFGFSHCNFVAGPAGSELEWVQVLVFSNVCPSPLSAPDRGIGWSPARVIAQFFLALTNGLA